MKKYLVFLLFTLSIFSAYGFDKEAFKQKLKSEANGIVKASEAYTKKSIAEHEALESKYKTVVSGKLDLFVYEGKDSNRIKVSGLYAYDFNSAGDEIYIPASTIFKNGRTNAEYTLNVEDNVYTDKSAFIIFSRNNIWYVGRFYINTNFNNMPCIEVLEVESLTQAVDIMVEMFTVHAYMYVNYKDYGFRNVYRIEENITYMDRHNIDWNTHYTFEMIVPRELMHCWGYEFCNAFVDVVKYNKLNGKLYKPYDWYVSHPLMLCDAMECTGCGAYEYVVSPFGYHKVDGLFYDERFFTPLSIVDTSAKYTFDVYLK